MDDESGESTEEDDVAGKGRSKSEVESRETGMRLAKRNRELIPETRKSSVCPLFIITTTRLI